MQKELENNSDTSVKVVSLIDFHGLTLWVIEHQGINYVQVKPLADLAGVAWRKAKTVVFNEDNAILYGTKNLQTPLFAVEGDLKVTRKQAIYIRLDRSRMYLARIDTGRMRSNGKDDAATKLLQLQIEWAEALDSYESNGVAYKKARHETEKSLKEFYNILKIAPKSHHKSIKQNIEQKWSELGLPVTGREEEQGELDFK